MRGRQDLIATLQRETELDDLERLARIARDRHLFGIAPEVRREPAAHGLDLGFDPSPHRDRRRLVRNREVALEGGVHDARRGCDAAVVQIDHAAIDIEGGLDLTPEVLVLRDVVGTPAGDVPRGREDARQSVTLQRGQGGRGGE